MAEIKFKGNPIHTIGNLPTIGANAPDFSLTKTDLSDSKLNDYSGKKVVLNIFPSIDTAVCATSVRKFNEQASKLENTVVLCISDDLPFAHKRFCGAEGLNNVISLSEMKSKDFGDKYGVRMTDGPLQGLLSRAVVVLNEKGNVIYTEQVADITQEPNYEKAIASLK